MIKNDQDKFKEQNSWKEDLAEFDIIQLTGEMQQLWVNSPDDGNAGFVTDAHRDAQLNVLHGGFTRDELFDERQCPNIIRLEHSFTFSENIIEKFDKSIRYDRTRCRMKQI